MNKIVPTLLAFADFVMPLKMFAAGASVHGLAGHTIASRYIDSSARQFRPDIAESIARGEYTFMQSNSREAGFHRRTALLRFQRLHSRQGISDAGLDTRSRSVACVPDR